MSAIHAVARDHAPTCAKCGGPVDLEVDFKASGTTLYARCRDEGDVDCGLTGWIQR